MQNLCCQQKNWSKNDLTLWKFVVTYKSISVQTISANRFIYSYIRAKERHKFSSKTRAFVTEAYSFELYWGYSQNYAHNEVYGFSVRASGHKNWKFMRDWIILIQILKSKYFLLWRNVYIHELATLVSETKTSYG